MFTERRFLSAALAGILLMTGVVVAQEESDTGTFTQRLSRFGRGLFDRPGREEPLPRENIRRPQAQSPPQSPAPKRSPGETSTARPAKSPAGMARSESVPPATSAAAPTATRSSRRTAQPTYENTHPESMVDSLPSARTSTSASDTTRFRSDTPSDTTRFRSETPSDVISLPEQDTEFVPEVAEAPPTTSDRMINSHAIVPSTKAGSLQSRLENARDAATAEALPPIESAAVTTNVSDSESFAEESSAVPLATPRSRIASASRTANPLADSKSHTVDTTGKLFDRQGPILSVQANGPSTIKVGAVSVFNLELRNSSTVEAEEVVVAIKIPEDTDIANTHASLGSTRPATSADGSATVEWTIPRVAARASAQLALGVIPRKNRPFELSTTWSHAPVGSTVAIDVQEPKLVMTLAGPEEVFFGEREVYKLTLSNPGNGDAENVLVRLLPTTPADDQAVSHQIGTLRAGENRVVELELTARQMGSLRLKAEAAGDGGLHASVDEEVLVRRADLKIQLEGPPLLYAGTIGAYKVNVSNPGNAIAKNVQVTAVLPAGASYLGCTEGGAFNQEQGRIVWTTSNLRPGASWTSTFRCELSHPGVNTAQVTGTADGDLQQIASTDTEVEALADLTLSVKDPPGPMPVGQDVSYEVKVKNRGTKAADGVEVIAFFSPGIEPSDVEGGPFEIGPGQISMAPIASLAPGQEIIFKIRARAHRSGNHIFRAEVECPTLETKLAAEETTRFYGNAAPSAAPPTPIDAHQAPVQEQEPSETETGLAPVEAGSDELVPNPETP